MAIEVAEVPGRHCLFPFVIVAGLVRQQMFSTAIIILGLWTR